MVSRKSGDTHVTYRRMSVIGSLISGQPFTPGQTRCLDVPFNDHAGCKEELCYSQQYANPLRRCGHCNCTCLWYQCKPWLCRLGVPVVCMSLLTTSSMPTRPGHLSLPIGSSYRQRRAMSSYVCPHRCPAHRLTVYREPLRTSACMRRAFPWAS